MTTDIAQHPDRLFPADPAQREVARRLYAAVADLPILSPHGHVDAAMLADDVPFPDPAALLISPDHYVTRLLHANGVPLERLRVGGSEGASPRESWREFCAHWNDFDGTASGYWLRQELVELFGVDMDTVTVECSDESFDAVAQCVASPEFRPRALFQRFGIEVLATTDDPLDSLAAHRRLTEDESFAGRVLPTFRPDRYTKLGSGFAQAADELVQAAGEGRSGYQGYISALENRRQHFIDHGAVSTDHGAHTPMTLRMDASEAAHLYEKGIAGTASAEEAHAFEAHMMYQMARMSVDDGLVMTIHPGVQRSIHTPTLERFGPDTGHDIPFAVDFVSGLRAVLEDFGTAEGFHLIPFTIDETVFSREIAPMAGFFPSVFIGAPWWFLDAPDAMLRFRAAVTETSGFTRSSGFIDDTRAFCSIPARHDTSRRIESAFLARLVTEHRLTEERAQEIIVDLVDASPRRAFKL